MADELDPVIVGILHRSLPVLQLQAVEKVTGWELMSLYEPKPCLSCPSEQCAEHTGKTCPFEEKK